MTFRRIAWGIPLLGALGFGVCQAAPAVPGIAPGKEPPTIEQICAKATASSPPRSDPVPVLRRAAMFHLLPVRASLLGRAPADAFGSFPLDGGGYESSTESTVFHALDLPRSCRTDTQIAGIQQITMEQARKERLSTSQIRLLSENLAPGLLADSLLSERLRREITNKKIVRFGRMVGEAAALGTVGIGSVLVTNVLLLPEIKDPLERRLAQLETQNLLLALHPNQSAQPLSELLVIELRTVRPDLVKSYMKTPVDRLEGDLDRDFRKARFIFDALPNRARFARMAETAYAYEIAQIGRQSAAICSAREDLAGYDNLIYPQLILSEIDPQSPVSTGDLCRLRAKALEKRARNKMLQVGGTAALATVSLVSLGAGGLAAAGVGGVALAQFGVEAGLVATSMGVILAGFDLVRLPGMERQALIAGGLFQAQLATYEQNKEMESQLASTLFNMVITGVAAPLDAAVALRSYKALKAAKALEAASGEATAGARALRTAMTGAESSADAWDDLFRRAAACGLVPAP
ncbi:MAG: hypothetical protein V1798_10610 [Pseudomonadota bacterium]